MNGDTKYSAKNDSCLDIFNTKSQVILWSYICGLYNESFL
jgi:hypothetical protein